MSKREQAIVGVFRIKRVICPVSVKAAGGTPKGIDEIEAGLLNPGDGI
jgi:hypothetical protein